MKLNTEHMLRKQLGDTYGGPSLGFKNGKFLIYRWYDAPVHCDILCQAPDLETLVARFERLPKNRRLGLPKFSKKKVVV
jgi:hypothetical protein